MPIRWCVSASSDCRRSPLITLLFGAWNGGEVLILAIYLQRVLGYSPLEAGLASVPQGLAGLIPTVNPGKPARVSRPRLAALPPTTEWSSDSGASKRTIVLMRYPPDTEPSQSRDHPSMPKRAL
jgi:hypothetical protein